MTLMEHIEKNLEEKEYKQTAKALVRIDNDEQEVLTFASLADILDSESSYLNEEYSHDDIDDYGVLNLYIKA